MAEQPDLPSGESELRLVARLADDAMPVRPKQRSCLDDAKDLLEKHGIRTSRIVSTDRDSILYLSPTGIACTAWLHRVSDELVRVQVESGFVSDPPAGWHRQPVGGAPAQGWT